MSEATVKALTDLVYDRLVDLADVDELDNEQIHNIAHVAAQTIESAGTTKAIIRAWFAEIDVTVQDMVDVFEAIGSARVERIALRMSSAIQEVSS